jgi:Uncharacterized iron-regulated protein
MFELIGKVSPETGIWEHISNMKFVEDSFKSTKNRSVVPLRRDVKPTPDGNHECELGMRDKRTEAFITRIMNNWGIGLILKYEKSGYIKPHRDGNGYGHKVVSVSSCDYELTIDNHRFDIPANTIISFNSKLLHSAKHSSDNNRYVICAWEYKRNYKR